MSRHTSSTRDPHAPDLVALRDLAPGGGEPTEESLARTRAAVLSRQHPDRRWWAGRRPVLARRAGLLLPVTAAALVAGLALGAAVLFAPGPSGSRSGPGTGLGPVGGDSPATSVRPDAGPGQAMPLTVAYLLRDVLPAAELVPPASLADDQFVRVRVEGVRAVAGGSGRTGGPEQGNLLVPHRYDLWVDHQSGIRAIRAYDDTDSGSRRRPDPAPSVTYPRSFTPDLIAGLPTDPTLLRERLSMMYDGAGQSAERRLMVGVADLFAVYDALLPGQVRVAAYRMLATLDGITGRTITVGGRELIALGHVEAGNAVELLLDPKTARTAGRQMIAVGVVPLTGPGANAMTRWNDAPVINRYLWEHEVATNPTARTLER